MSATKLFGVKLDSDSNELDAVKKRKPNKAFKTSSNYDQRMTGYGDKYVRNYVKDQYFYRGYVSKSQTLQDSNEETMPFPVTGKQKGETINAGKEA